MRLALVLMLAAAAHAADVKDIKCDSVEAPRLPQQMTGKTPPEYNCLIIFTGKAPKNDSVYVTKADGGTMVFSVSKGWPTVTVATGQSPAVSAKLGVNGKQVSTAH